MKKLIAAFLVTMVFPSFVMAQTAGSQEDVQIQRIDFDSQILRITNFGSSEQMLDGWRFCTHDEVDGFDYTSSTGLNGVVLSAGEFLDIHWNDDASGANSIDVSSLGGNWIDDLTASESGDGISIGLYRNGSFGSDASMIDHVQYSFGGANVGGSANPRGGVAVSAELWTSTDDWVSVGTDSLTIELTADPFPGAGAAHGSSSYTVSAVPEPSSVSLILMASLACLGRRRR